MPCDEAMPSHDEPSHDEPSHDEPNHAARDDIDLELGPVEAHSTALNCRLSPARSSDRDASFPPTYRHATRAHSCFERLPRFHAQLHGPLTRT